MSMLADKRKKTNYCLQPKGKPLHNDTNSFGMKMLQKMGWEAGKGLGKNESGNQDFIRIKHKQDIKGLGYTDKDDQWTDHEKNYNSLLNNLNNYESEASNNSDGNKTKLSDFKFGEKYNYVKISGESLEEKSRKSRARLHYKKFTKGKDISQYSEKDLANIFGKKSFEIAELGGKVQSDATTEYVENNMDTLTFNSSSSVKDYFKEKMKKKKLNIENEENFVKSNKHDTTKSDNEYSNNKIVENQVESDAILNKLELKTEKIVKAKNKSKKKKPENDLGNPNFETAVWETDTLKSIEHTQVKKHAKKRKGENQLIHETSEESCTIKLCNGVNLNDKYQKEEGTSKISEQRTAIDDKRKKGEKHENTTRFEKLLLIQNECKTDLQDCSSIVIKAKGTKHDKQNNMQVDNNLVAELGKNNVPKDNSTVHNLNCIDTQSCKNIIQISQYCAEKFRHTDLNGFKGSNIKDLCGYGLSKNYEVKINITTSCNEQISNFYKSGIIDIKLSDKYGISDTKKFQKYKKKASLAKKLKKKVPNFNVTHLKKKSLFKQVKI